MSMTLIERINVTTSANLTYTFSNIPQAYTDLFITIVGMSSGSNTDAMIVRFNGDATSTYTGNILRWTTTIGNDGGFIAQNANQFIAAQYGQSNLSPWTVTSSIWIPNYTGSNQKTWNSIVAGNIQTESSNNLFSLYTGWWTGTAALTSVTFSGYGQYPTTGSTYTLYGVK